MYVCVRCVKEERLAMYSGVSGVSRRFRLRITLVCQGGQGGEVDRRKEERLIGDVCL